MRGVVFAIVCLLACGGKRDVSKIEGLAITYSIDLDVAVIDREREVQRDFEHMFAEEHIAGTATLSADGTLVIAVDDLAHKPRVETNIRDYTNTLERVACPATVGDRGVCVRIAPAHAASIRKTAVDQTVRTIRERIDERKIEDVVVRAQGDDIVVEVPKLDPDKLAAMRSLIARGGRLEFTVVDVGSPYMETLHRNASTDSAARDAEITAEIDTWKADDGVRRTDYYLVAHEHRVVLAADEAKRVRCRDMTPVADGKVECVLTGRAILERYLSALAQIDPQLAVPANRRFGYEIGYPLPDARDRRPYTRTYLLEARARLTGRAVSNATKSVDPYLNRPIVLLDFNRAGASTFGEVTASIVGGKLAIVLDDRITSAPIINGPIRGGRASITMGTNTPEHMDEDADELATVLRTGSLPAPLREESVRER